MLVFFKHLIWGPFGDVTTVKTTQNGLQGPYTPRGSLGRILGNLKGTLKFSPEALWGPKISILWKLGSDDLYTSFGVLYLGFPMSYV